MYKLKRWAFEAIWNSYLDERLWKIFALHSFCMSSAVKVLSIVIWELERKFNLTRKKVIVFEFPHFSKPPWNSFQDAWPLIKLWNQLLTRQCLQHMATDCWMKFLCASLWRGNTHFHEQISFANDSSWAQRVYIHWISHHVRKERTMGKVNIRSIFAVRYICCSWQYKKRDGY